MQHIAGSNYQMNCQMHSKLNQTTLPIKQTSQQNVDFDHQNKECRICLSSSQQNHNNQLVSPCECTGSLKYVHRDCLKKWLQMKLLKEAEAEEQSASSKATCELCLKAIKVKIQLKTECRKGSKILSQIKQSPVLFGVCSVGMLISLSILLYSIFVFAQQVQEGYNEVDPISKSVVLVSLVIEIVLFIYFGLNLLKFLLKRRAILEFEDNL